MNRPQGPQHDPNAAPPPPPGGEPPVLPEPVITRRSGWLPSLVWLAPLRAPPGRVRARAKHVRGA
ncbi:hypothetical protein, partial [Burkholderia pseudomallei]|uniref:hypothetical protein n=1 Tax=Burkholderia pseudomallei TaxID=28450 RepID=UPI0015C3120E